MSPRLAQTKARMSDMETLARRQTFQRNLAHHTGMWHAARAGVLEAFATVESAVGDGAALTPTMRADIRRRGDVRDRGGPRGRSVGPPRCGYDRDPRRQSIGASLPRPVHRYSAHVRQREDLHRFGADLARPRGGPPGDLNPTRSNMTVSCEKVGLDYFDTAPVRYTASRGDRRDPRRGVRGVPRRRRRGPSGCSPSPGSSGRRRSRSRSARPDRCTCAAVWSATRSSSPGSHGERMAFRFNEVSKDGIEAFAEDYRVTDLRRRAVPGRLGDGDDARRSVGLRDGRRCDRSWRRSSAGRCASFRRYVESRPRRWRRASDGDAPSTPLDDDRPHRCVGVGAGRTARLARPAARATTPCTGTRSPTAPGSGRSPATRTCGRSRPRPAQFSSWVGGPLRLDPDPDNLEQLRMVIIGMDPPDHRTFRSIVSKAFTPKMIDRLDDALRAETTRVVGELRDSDQLRVRRRRRRPDPDVVDQRADGRARRRTGSGSTS